MNIYIEKIKRNLIEILTLLILSIVFVIIIDEVFYIDIINTLQITNIKSIFISTLLVFALFLILRGTTKNLTMSVIIFSVITFMFSIINIIKIHYTENPILFSDLNFLSNSKELLELINGNLIYIIKDKILIIYILLSILILICLISILIKKVLIKEKQKKKEIYIIQKI